MQFATSGYFETVHIVSFFYTKADIRVQLAEKTVAQMTRCDKFSFLTGQRTVIYHEMHSDCRFRDLLERNWFRMLRRTDRIANMDISYA